MTNTSTRRARSTGSRKTALKGGLGGGAKPPSSQVDDLVNLAARTRDHAHAPYSQFKVGAAIATKSGGTYAGCNVENASYPNGMCAERGAIAAMVAAGDRDPVLCVIVTEAKVPAPPCGMCRQVLIEFARNMTVVLVGRYRGRETRRTLELAKLMPEVFEFAGPAAKSDGLTKSKRKAKTV